MPDEKNLPQEGAEPVATPPAENVTAGTEATGDVAAKEQESLTAGLPEDLLKQIVETLKPAVVQEVKKALKTSSKKQPEVSPDVIEAVKARESEVKTLAKTLEAIKKELEDLVEAEINSVSEEDRMVLDGILDPEMDPVTKLRIIRQLRNAGKLSPKGETPKPAAEVGGAYRPARATGKNVLDRFQQLYETGKKLAQRRQKQEGYVPPEWQGR